MKEYFFVLLTFLGLVVAFGEFRKRALVDRYSKNSTTTNMADVAGQKVSTQGRFTVGKGNTSDRQETLAPTRWTPKAGLTFREYELAAKRFVDEMSTNQVPELRTFTSALLAAGVPDDRINTTTYLTYVGATVRAKYLKQLDEQRERIEVYITKVHLSDETSANKKMLIDEYLDAGRGWIKTLESELNQSMEIATSNMIEATGKMEVAGLTNLLYICPRIPAIPLPGL